MKHKALWTVSLSDGSTLYEGKGDYATVEGRKSPWLRLLDFLNDNPDVRITSMALYAGDTVWNLPSAGKSPKFATSANAPKPVSYRFSRQAIRDIFMPGKAIGQVHAIGGSRIELKPTHGRYFRYMPDLKDCEVTVFNRSRHQNAESDPDAYRLLVRKAKNLEDHFEIVSGTVGRMDPKDVFFMVWRKPEPERKTRNYVFSVIEANFDDGRTVQVWVDEETLNSWVQVA